MNSPTGANTSPNESVPDQRQSGLGVASFALSLVASVATIVVFGYAGYVEATTEGGVAGDNAVAILIGLAVFACVAMLSVGIVLGVIGLLQKGRRKTLAAVGVGLNGLFAILILMLMWIGLAQG